MTHRPLTCDEAIARLDDYLDRELSADEMALVREHLNTCAHCAEAYAFEGNVLDDLKGKLRRIDLPESVIDKVRSILANNKPEK
jgi:anti-sigma factor (TIGR02949 family)